MSVAIIIESSSQEQPAALGAAYSPLLGGQSPQRSTRCPTSWQQFFRSMIPPYKTGSGEDAQHEEEQTSRSHASDSASDFSERCKTRSGEDAQQEEEQTLRSHASDSASDFSEERAIFANFFAFDAVTSVLMIFCVCGYFCGGLWRDLAAKIEDMNTHTAFVAIGFFAPLALLFVVDATMCFIIVRRFDQGGARVDLLHWLLPKLALTGALTGTWLVFKFGLFLDIETGAITEKHGFQFLLSIILTIVIARVKINKMVQTIKCSKRLFDCVEKEKQIQPVLRGVQRRDDPTYKIGFSLVLSSVFGFFLVWLVYNSVYNGYQAENSSAATIANFTAENSSAATILEEDVGDGCGVSDVVFPALLGSAVADFIWAFVIGIVVMLVGQPTDENATDSKPNAAQKKKLQLAGLAAAAALALIVGPASAIYSSQEPCSPGKSFCGGFVGAFAILSLGLSKYFGFA